MFWYVLTFGSSIKFLTLHRHRMRHKNNTLYKLFHSNTFSSYNHYIYIHSTSARGIKRRRFLQEAVLPSCLCFKQRTTHRPLSIQKFGCEARKKEDGEHIHTTSFFPSQTAGLRNGNPHESSWKINSRDENNKTWSSSPVCKGNYLGFHFSVVKIDALMFINHQTSNINWIFPVKVLQRTDDKMERKLFIFSR